MVYNNWFAIKNIRYNKNKDTAMLYNMQCVIKRVQDARNARQQAGAADIVAAPIQRIDDVLQALRER